MDPQQSNNPSELKLPNIPTFSATFNKTEPTINPNMLKRDQNAKEATSNSLDTTVDTAADMMKFGASKQHPYTDKLQTISSSDLTARYTSFEADTGATKPTSEEIFYATKTQSVDFLQEEIQNSLELNELKPTEHDRQNSSTSFNSSEVTVQLEAPDSTLEHNGESHCRTFPLFDNMIGAFKEIPERDEPKREESTKRQQPTLVQAIQTIMQLAPTTSTQENNEFQLPNIPSSQKTIKTIKEKQDVPETKQEVHVQPDATDSLNANEKPIQHETTSDTTKQAAGFQPQSNLYFGRTIDAKKDALKLDATQKNKDLKRQDSPPADGDLATLQPKHTTTTSNKEREFQLPKMPSLETIIDQTKEAPDINENNQGKNQKSVISNSSNAKAAAIPQDTTSPATKNEEASELTTTLSLNGTIGPLIQRPIVEQTVALETMNLKTSVSQHEKPEAELSKTTTSTRKKQGSFSLRTTQFQQRTTEAFDDSLHLDATEKRAPSIITAIPSIKPSKQPATSKSQGEFQLPITFSNDGTIQGIKDTSTIDTANKQQPSADTGTGNVETSTATNTPKNGGEFQLPTIPSFDPTVQGMKDTFRIDTAKEEVPSADTRTGSVELSKETITPKKEGGFQLPTIPSFDRTVQGIKDTFRIDTAKEEVPSADTRTGSVELSKETITPKKEGGFQLPTIASFDPTVQGMKDTYRIHTAKEDAPSADTATGSVDSSKDTITPKKEGGFQLPAIPSFDRAIQGIKDTLRIDTAKEEVPSADTRTGSVELSKETITPKKEEGFQLPTILSFDRTVQGIKDTFRIDTAKEEVPSADTRTGSVELSKETITPKKEGGFQLPTIPSFDRTIIRKCDRQLEFSLAF
ncbi:unnamed protein product [Rotaria sp. Silwood2]|nr:unnamed protein product [Rotaria sp. Silwood2]